MTVMTVAFLMTSDIYKNLAIHEPCIFNALSKSNLNKNNFSIDVCLSRDTRETIMLIMWLVVIRTLLYSEKKEARVKHTLDFAD